MHATALQTTHHTTDRGAGRALRYHRRRLANGLILALSDATSIAGAMAIAGTVRSWLLGAALIPDWIWLVVFVWWIAAYLAGLLPSWGLDAVTELRKIVILLSLLFAATAILLFLTKKGAEMSRLTVTVGFFLTVPVVPMGRAAVKTALVRQGYWGVPTVIYGIGGASGRVISALREERGLGYIPVGVFDDDPELWGEYVEGIPVLGSMHQSAPSAPVAVLVASGIPQDWVATLLEGPLSRYKQTVVVPDLSEVPSLWVKSRNLAGILGLEITSNLLDPVAQVVKRTLDLALVLGTIPIWLPVYGAIAAAIRLSDGHRALFYQERLGKNNRPFKIPKFRTMRPAAEDLLHQILDVDPMLRAEWDAGYKLSNDPRVTTIGRFLRRWSLDELPQLMCVMRGDMSLVGPRPLPRYHSSELDTRIRELRARVRPGMTGQWQVSGRSDAGTEGMERWDSYYVRNWSVWLDLIVLLRTVAVVLRRKGAY